MPHIFYPDWMEERCYSSNVKSLDKVLFLDDSGDPVTMVELIHSPYWTARFTLLKTMFMSGCRNKTDKAVAELLFEGYSMEEIADKVHIRYDTVRHIVVELRKRCLEYKKIRTQLNNLKRSL